MLILKEDSNPQWIGVGGERFFDYCAYRDETCFDLYVLVEIGFDLIGVTIYGIIYGMLQLHYSFDHSMSHRGKIRYKTRQIISRCERKIVRKGIRDQLGLCYIFQEFYLVLGRSYILFRLPFFSGRSTLFFLKRLKSLKTFNSNY